MVRDPFLEAGLSNPEIVDEYYQRYLNNPSQLDSSWKSVFQAFEKEIEQAKKILEEPIVVKKEPPVVIQTPDRDPKPVIIESKEKENEDDSEVLSLGDMRLYNLIHAYRTNGHRFADVNPVSPKSNQMPKRLDPRTWGFSKKDLSQQFPTCGLMRDPEASLKEIIDVLQEVYCGTIGLEYMGLNRSHMEKWIQDKIEPQRCKPNLSIEEKKAILMYLNRSELFEVFLHTKYVGQKRFSLEGGETLIPMLNALIERGAEAGVDQFVIGMAHRGRLNVLSNILNKSYREIFSEFEESYIPGSFEGSGDVKYHKGFESKRKTSSGRDVVVSLAANPSHLEAVGSIVCGKTRARQVIGGDDVDMHRVVPIVIHGDAAISGQGIVYELLQLYRLPGYGTGGTLHIIVNNQIGFTTLPKDSRSTPYCTDIAKGFSSPIFHVNAEDPEGAVFAIKLAMEIRQEFGCDVFIELNCYRKFGHNEGDEPAYTQPLEYKTIKSKSSIREIYRNQLVSQGIVEKALAEMLEEEFKSSLQEALNTGKLSADNKQIDAIVLEKQERLKDARIQIFDRVKTGVSQETLRKIAQQFCSVPQDFSLHPKLQKLLKDRLDMVAESTKESKIDWGMAEHLAFASLLWEQFHVRLSGQDSRRGTFSHRHAMWVDQENAKKFFPLSKLKEGQGRFDVFNSPLSEYAVLGFEFGYSLDYQKALVIWEAQFGDFGNGAQIVIDQFIASCEQKWGATTRLVLLLPHGYEGQGPEHSSGRMERFLQLAGDYNMLICDVSTPAQFFHLLRRQVLHPLAKPLIVFTPKGLLRHPQCVSSIKELAEGSFQEILSDQPGYEKAERILLCTGAVYYELVKERAHQKRQDIAIVRIEQLYPLHKEKLKEVLGLWTQASEFVWVQEEPQNMGAWEFIHSQIEEVLPQGKRLGFAGRPRSASPAVGSYALHKREVVKLLADAFKREGKPFHEISVNLGVRG